MGFGIFLCLAPLVSGFTLQPVSYLNKVIGRVSVKTFEPKYDGAKNGSAVLFFTGGNSYIPGDIYENFLSELAGRGVTVHVSPGDLDESEYILDKLVDQYEDVTCVGHSSGCVNLVKTANTNREVRKAIMMDPVNNDKIFQNMFTPVQMPKFPWEDMMKDSKKGKELVLKYIKKMLLLKAKKSYEWKLIPPEVPFLFAFTMDEKKIVDKDVDLEVVETDDKGHADILDVFWADIMHNTVSKGQEDRSPDKLREYHSWLADKIADYISGVVPIEASKESEEKDLSEKVIDLLDEDESNPVEVTY